MIDNQKFKVVSIKELLLKGYNEKDLRKICDDLYNITDFISEDYPKYNTWFYKKHLPAVFEDNSGRDIIFAYDEDKNIYGTAFIKEDSEEKKICTLFVKPEARGLGVGTLLVEKSMEILKTTKPMITLADYKLPMFEGLIKKYGWE
ncbi:MAG: GNAT family N-acetyltransferase, partial [Clostridia bacterium]|nr:GNAT family N-acetyltransferase [Clostridia bacterium]